MPSLRHRVGYGFRKGFCTSGVETGVFTGDDKLKHKGTRETGLS